ncbi:MAG: ribosome recycling factor [Patescibacteria group bacterium]
MDTTTLKQKMQAAIDVTVKDISSLRTGRASSSLVENIIVPAYGGTQRLRVLEVASITTPDPQSIIIDPWDKSILGDIRKGILEANVGLNPTVGEGNLRISIPPMTTEDREKYVKLLSVKMENGRVMIRQTRADAMQTIKKGYEAKDITEDEKFAQEKQTQQITDEYVKKLEDVGEAKKQELLSL